jgi:hypothetical protein
MSRTAAKVKQIELTRYVKAVIAAGMEVAEIKINPDGSVRILPAPSVEKSSENPCDRLLAR